MYGGWVYAGTVEEMKGVVVLIGPAMCNGRCAVKLLPRLACSYSQRDPFSQSVPIANSYLCTAEASLMAQVPTPTQGSLFHSPCPVKPRNV